LKETTGFAWGGCGSECGLAGYPWTRIYMLPVERYASLIDRTPTSPPQPMHESKVAPADLEEA